MEKRKNGNLIRDRISRSQPHKDIIFGTRAIIEAINAGKEIDKLLIQKGINNNLIKELTGLAHTLNIPYSKVPIEKLNRVTKKNHQGAICYISSVNYSSLDNIISSCYEKGKSPFIVILDRITDVRNFGAVARTAECAGVDAIIVPQRGSAQISSDAMKTSAGALNFIPVCREPNLKDTINYLKDSGVYVLACTEKTEQYLYDISMEQPIAIILGSEENGISPEYLKLASGKAKIPMDGHIASLNVSVAAGVAIFECVRQRKGQHHKA